MAEHSSVFDVSNTFYDKLRTITQLWLPGLGTFYFALAGIWGLPFAEQVVGTVTALVTLCGVFLGLSRKAYSNAGKDGTVEVRSSAEDESLTVVIAPTLPFDEVPDGATISLKVNHTDS